MNWDTIVAIGQMLGSLAVFASVRHLATQIRESARLARHRINLERYRTTFMFCDGEIEIFT